MGDAYRGLTIRIGADATPLQRSISNISKAANAATKDMRKLSNQLKLDPKNVNLIERQVSAIGTKAKAAASQFGLMNGAVRQYAAQYGSMTKMLSAIENSETKAASLRNQYNLVNQSLQKVYDNVAKFNSSVNGTKLDDEVKKLKKLRTEALSSSEAYKTLISQIRQTYAKSGSLEFGAKDMDAMIRQVERLRNESRAMATELGRLDDKVGIKNAVNDLRIFNSQVKTANQELAETIAKQHQLGNGNARKAAIEMERYSDAIREAEQRERMLDSAIQGVVGRVAAAASKMKALEDQVALYQRRQEQANNRLKQFDGSQVERIRAEFVTTANAVSTVGSELARANIKVDKLEALLSGAKNEAQLLAKNGARFGTEYQSALVKIKKIESALAKARQEAALVGQRFKTVNEAHSFMEAKREVEICDAKIKQLRGTISTTKSMLGQFGMAVRNMGYTWTATFGAGSLMIGRYAIQSAENLDSAYRNMRKTVNGTEEQFEALKQAALEYSQVHYTSADKLLEIESIGGQLGIQARNLQAFSQTVSNLDIATNLDTDTISQNLGQLSNIMNDMNQNLVNGPGSFQAYADALVRLGNNSAAQEDKIQNVMMRIASMGTISGMTTPDLLALATATAATGQGAEAAGTALSKTFSAIEGSVNGAKIDLQSLADTYGMSDDELSEYVDSLEKAEGKLVNFAHVAGMSAEELSALWNSTDGGSMQAFQAFIEGLKRIDEEGGSVDNTLVELGITSVRQKQTLMGLTQTVDVLRNSMQMSNDAWNGISDIWGDSGDAAREAQRKAEGFSGQLQILKNNGMVLANLFTESLTPAITGLGDIVRGATNAFSGWSPELRTTVSLLGVLAAAGGPATIALGGIMAAIGSIRNFKASMGNAWALALQGGGKLDKLGTSVINLGSKMTNAAGQTTKMGKAIQSLGLGIGTLSFGKLLGIGAGIGAVALAIGGIVQKTNEWNERMENNAAASETMADRIAKGMRKASDSIDKARNSTIDFNEALNSHESFITKAAQGAKKMQEAADEFFTKKSGIEYYRQDITKYLDDLEKGSRLTSVQIADLKSKVDGYNEATGEQIQVIESADGSLQVLRNSVTLTAEEFNNLADKAIASAEASYYSLERANSQSQIIAAKNDLVNQQAALEKLINERFRGNIDAAKSSGAFWELVNAIDATAEALAAATNSERYAAQMTEYLKLATDGAQGAMKQFLDSHEDMKLAFAANNAGILDFISGTEKLGVSVDDLASNEAKVTAGLRQWQGDFPSLISVLKEAGIQIDDTKAKMALLDGFEFKEKVLRVNGEQVYDGEQLLGTLDSFFIDDHEYKVTLEGIQEVDGELTSFKDAAEDKPITVNIEGEFKSLDEGLETRLHDRSINVSVNYVGGNNPLAFLSSFGTSGFSTGGFTKLHAAGAFITDGPTYIGMDNKGVRHIAGEAGREFVQAHADGTTSIIPIQNKKYMKPFANTVAQMIGSGGNTYNLYLYANTNESPEQFADDVMRRVKQIERAEGR